MRTVKFFTLGCKVNQYDTQSIREQFLEAGFQELEDGNPADIYVINTCSVTQRADCESLNLIRKAKKENPQAKVVVTGCLTERDSDKITRISGDIRIIKNRGKDDILRLLNWQTGEPANRPTARGISCFYGHTRAFLKIQDGCDNFCSYCKVPLVRGNSRSKPLDAVISEAERLAKNGFKEIVLCGICLGDYGKDLQPEINLVNAIEELEKISGLLRIRLSSIEVDDITDELIQKMAGSKKLCPHLHIPLQSGDDEILRKMNRNYSATGYLNLVHQIKSQIPSVAITTDVMVGFPAETEVNFQNTVKLIKEILPLKVHIFLYSSRKGTPASGFKPTISPKIIKERINHLKNIAETCAFEYKTQFLDKEMNVLIERRSKGNPLFWEGYTDNYIKVWVKSEQDLKNQLIPLRISLL